MSVGSISDNIEANVSVSEDIDHMDNMVDGHSLEDEELKSSDAEIIASDELSICSLVTPLNVESDLIEQIMIPEQATGIKFKSKSSKSQNP